MPDSVRVWDPLVRACHWLLVVCVASAWMTREGNPRWHEIFGYAALATVVIRLLWGFFGPRYAKFAQFVRPPGATLDYAKQLLATREPRYIGHNPLGGWMIVLLLVNLTLVGASGWLYTTDAYWGVEWVEDLHSVLSDLLLALITLHVAGVLYTSIRHRENLVAAMLHGRKPAAPEPLDK